MQKTTNTRRKNTRLPSMIYGNPSHIFSITICTWERLPTFSNTTYAQILTGTLRQGLFADKTKIYAYCLMPDHLHLLISPSTENLNTMINRWKSFTANLLRREGLKTKCWQRGFYDHALRRDEDIKTTAEYVVHNPVRAGFVMQWQAYPHSWHIWMK